MSFDLAIFFPHAAFPAQEWCDMLKSFRSEACEVTFEETGAGGSCGAKNCSLVADGSLISVDVCSIDDPPNSCAPSDTQWRALVSTTMGRSGLAWWIQFAIPYHALVLFPGTCVHDCQHHLGRSVKESSWTSPEIWRQYAERTLWRTMGSKEPLIERGLFDADGTVRF
jgi:hypothetical protein